MTDPVRTSDERQKVGGLEKAFTIFVWVFVSGVTLVTLAYVVLFIMWGMSV